MRSLCEALRLVKDLRQEMLEEKSIDVDDWIMSLDLVVGLLELEKKVPIS